MFDCVRGERRRRRRSRKRGGGATEGEHVPAAPLPAGHVSSALTPRARQRGGGEERRWVATVKTGCAHTHALAHSGQSLTVS